MNNSLEVFIEYELFLKENLIKSIELAIEHIEEGNSTKQTKASKQNYIELYKKTSYIQHFVQIRKVQY